MVVLCFILLPLITGNHSTINNTIVPVEYEKSRCTFGPDRVVTL